MADEELLEVAEFRTAGLASALQVIDHTGSPVFIATQSTSITPTVVAFPVLPRLAMRELVRTPNRVVRFETALRESLRENNELLRELAKY